MGLTKEQRVIQQIISRAWSDADFKAALIKNPIAAIERLTGERISLPEGKRLVVQDQSDKNVVFLNIPAQPDFDDVELTDQELEVVAGGGVPAPSKYIMEKFPTLPPILKPGPVENINVPKF